MIELIGIENQTGTPGELVCPRAGDRVTWASDLEVWLGVPSLSTSTRSGVVHGVDVDTSEGWCFDACLDNGTKVWGYLGNILTINGESVPNTARKKAARILGLTVA